MTIGIGVLATTDEGRKAKRVPDTAILLADTMGSYDDADSHSRLHKAIMLPDDRVYAACAGDVSKAAQLLPCICTFLREIPVGARTYGKIQTAIAEGCFQYKQHLFTTFELPKFRLAPHAFNPNQKLDSELNEKIQAAWDQFDCGCDLIIAAFGDDGIAYLFRVMSQEHAVYSEQFPGFSAIGVGADNAIFWLSRRAHTMGLLPLRAGYHAYEAKLTAEGSGHVNQHLDLIVANADEHWFSTTHKSLHGEKEHPEINVQGLKKLLREYWIRKTDELGAVIKPSAARKSTLTQ